MHKNLLKFTEREKQFTAALFNHFDTIEEYSFTTGNVCYDASVYLKNGTKILCETKVRDFELSKYPDYILEVNKLLNVGKKAKDWGYKFYYINFFKTDNPEINFIIFNITERINQWKITPPKVTVKYMNDATFKSASYKVPKEVILLQYDETMDSKGTITLN